VPLIIRAPWLKEMVGQRSQHLVELVDIYRTVLDLAGAPEPTGDTLPIEGVSLAPLLGGGGTWKPKPALTMYPRVSTLATRQCL
jgi:arylsulfatase A-like enzyme